MPQVIGHSCLVGGLLQRSSVLIVAAQTHVLVVLFFNNWKGSTDSTQQLVQVLGQASFTPWTLWHRHPVDFLLVHLHVLFFVRPSLKTALNNVVESLQLEFPSVGDKVTRGDGDGDKAGNGGKILDEQKFRLDSFPQTPLQFNLPSKCSWHLLVNSWNHSQVTASANDTGIKVVRGNYVV